jgi:hypothetical protein
MSTAASSCGQACSRGRQRGPDSMVLTCRWRPSASVTPSRWALTNARELYASAEARASIITKQEEELATRARQVNQREKEVEKLEGLL